MAPTNVAQFYSLKILVSPIISETFDHGTFLFLHAIHTDHVELTFSDI